jgi:hypothetical protein
VKATQQLQEGQRIRIHVNFTGDAHEGTIVSANYTSHNRRRSGIWRVKVLWDGMNGFIGDATLLDEYIQVIGEIVIY